MRQARLLLNNALTVPISTVDSFTKMRRMWCNYFPFSSIAAKWKLHFCLYLLNPKYYQNEIWSDTSVSYKKHF